MIGHIIGLAFLPVSIMLFLKEFGIIAMSQFFGFSLLLLGAIGVIGTEIGDIISAHMSSSKIVLTWIIGILLCAPAFIYFISLFVALPAKLQAALPLMIASFLFVEGLSSFFIDTN